MTLMKKPLAHAITLACATFMLGGCVQQDFIRPSSQSAQLPDRFDAPQTSQAQEKSNVQPQWWALFGDGQLTALIEQAQRNNADVRTAVARVAQAEAAAKEAGVALLPVIDLQGTGTNNKLSTKTATWSQNSPDILRARTGGISTSYELDVWGRVRASTQSADATLQANRYSADAVRLTVNGLIASHYFALRSYDAQLNVTIDSVKSRQASLKLVEAREAAGLASPLDRHQAASALASAQAQESDLRRQRSLRESQIALLCGEPNLRISSGDLSSIPLPPQPPAGLPADLIEARPDIRQAEAQLAAANANISVARAGYYPKFTLTGSLGSESKSLADLFGAGAGTWGLGLSLAMPLLDYGRTAARVDQAKALNEQSLIAWQNSLQTAYKEVRDALVSLQEYSLSEAAQNQRVSNTREVLRLANLRYEAGYVGYLDVLDAQRSFNDAQLAAISTRQARLGASVDLFKALGGGWKAATPTAQP